MFKFRIQKLIARLEYMEGKKVTLTEVSKITRVHRSQISKIFNNSGSVSLVTVRKVVNGFFWKFRKYDSKSTDESLYRFILTELIASDIVVRALMSTREVNRTKTEKTEMFNNFPDIHERSTPIE